ncbi:acyl-ACP--UDP-N-acetylglucosamine O-acyltransferase [Palleronia caenipelagi]|uniref:Acyl-[acyl-carrier-protein]--UDP-N-acetylglucosamine O-acyltransferase n=1 Tax=Palleronia caenipelagi TaxID=2489174 RepID=A0A547Q636_9RHOB|nr:acyl-ACP--UDP-N-acetylglucosamine O-acyltransferase [Palleronia caenipelagi]TRD21843.1 acyl-ACP--UDP-N-acetylglucosamine O-acyltransferase [Palleronia caenipelagi]
MSGIHPEARIHPQAVVDPGATIGAGTSVGPFSIIGPEVVLGERVDIRSHVVVTGQTSVGDETVIFPFAVIGEIPQDLKFGGEKTSLEIGARCRIREHATLNTGTEGGGSLTKVGDDCLIMAGAHVAHDCMVGNRVIMVNNSALAGHCHVGDDAILGGLSGAHQWVRIGEGAIIGGLTMVTADVLPYALVQGPRGHLDGLNLVGLKRRGVDRKDINALRVALQVLRQDEGSFKERAKRVGEDSDSAYVDQIVEFILGDSDRGFLTP